MVEHPARQIMIPDLCFGNPIHLTWLHISPRPARFRIILGVSSNSRSREVGLRPAWVNSVIRRLNSGE